MPRCLSFISLFLAGVLAASSTLAQDQIPITVGAGAAVYHTPVFVAAEKGIFEKHGLDAKVLVYQSGVEQINGQINDEQLVTLLGAAPFVSAVSNGMPLKIIAGFHGNPLKASYADIFGVAASGQSGAAKVEELAGKKIGLHLGSGSEIYMSGVLSDHGLSRDDVEFVHVTAANSLAALSTGEIDALAVWEPWIANAVTQGDATEVIHGGCSACYEPGITITTERNIVENKEAIQRYLLAFAEAQQWVRQNKEESASIAARWLPGTDEAVLLKVLETAPLDMRLSKNIYTGLNERTVPTLLDLDRIKREVKAEDVVDPAPYIALQESAPEFFSDLPAIPDDVRF